MRIFLVVGIAVALFVVLLFTTLRSVTLTSLSPSGIEEVSRDHLKLTGTMKIINRGTLPIQVTRGTVDLLLAEDGTKLTSSEFSGFWLSAGQERDIPFGLHIEWEPTSRVAKDLIAGGQGSLVLESRILVLQVFSFSFRNHFDLKPMLGDLIRRSGEALLDTAGQRLQELWDRISPR